MNRVRVKIENSENSGDDEDRLSTLPDGVLSLILSFLDTKYAVQMCLVSKRYKNIWSSLTCLNFDRSSFSKLSSFNKFVDQTLTLRDNSMRVDSFKSRCNERVSFTFLDKVLSYAMSHTVLGLNIDLPSNESNHSLESWCSLDSLRTFELKTWSTQCENPLSFSELKVLRLENVVFTHSDLFLSCPSLTDLTMISCSPPELDTWYIGAPQLTKLTITDPGWLSLNGCKFVVSAPMLASFSYTAYAPLLLSAGELSGLYVVNIDVHGSYFQTQEERKKRASDLVNFLQSFRNAKSVKLSMRTIQVLSSFPDLLEHEFSPFVNMKSLTLKGFRKSSTIGIPVHVMNYLLSGSPCAEFFMELPGCERCRPHKRCMNCRQ